jgi:hypothetical protein
VFFPIGQDFGPLIHNNGPNQCGTMMHPNDVTSYIGHISNLADQGGNFIRIPMDIHNFALEWEEAKVYGSNRKLNENFKRQYSANSLDKVFDKIESRNVYSILLSETDNVFQVDAAYKCGPVSETAWPAHPYAVLSDYGVNDPLDIFGIPSVFNDIYKKRLFYMNARYGYSPNLAVYEVCNEIDGIERGSAKHYETNGSTRSVVYNWAVNTADYLKSFYPSHMTTISFRDLSVQDPWQPMNPTSSPSFDIRTPHHYGWDKYVPVTRVDKVNTHLYGLGGSEIMPRTTKKPVLFGEMGMSDEMGRADTCTDAEFHKGMWASGCSGAAGAGLYRYDYESDSKRNAHFPALHAFFDNMPFATDEFYGDDAWAPQGDPTIGVIYNYTGSKHKAYGWLYNFHYYWATDPGLLSNCVQDDHGVQYGSSGAYFQEVELKNFQNSHMYNIELWRAYDGGGVQFFFHEQATLLAGKIKIKRDVGSCTSCEYAPDYGLKIYKEDGNFIMATTDEYSDKNKGDIYMQNDTMDWQNGKFQVTGSFNPNINYHFWDFGNGKTSNEQYPFLEYSKPGSYNLVYSTLNSNGDTVRYHQKVVALGKEEKDKLKGYKNRPNIDVIPNPSTGIFNLSNPQNLDILSINVFDSKGSLVMSFKDGVAPINLSKFDDGLYNIVILTDKMMIYKKVIKIE